MARPPRQEEPRRGWDHDVPEAQVLSAGVRAGAVDLAAGREEEREAGASAAVSRAQSIAEPVRTGPRMADVLPVMQEPSYLQPTADDKAIVRRESLLLDAPLSDPEEEKLEEENL